MSRGVLWMVWGHNQRVEAALPRSRASVAKWHPELEQTVRRMPDDSDLRCKARMFDLSPYEQTLYLDADTVVLGNLDFGFEKASQHGIACAINVSPFANRYIGLADRGAMTEFDTGVLFFDKTFAPDCHACCRLGVDDVFSAWKAGDHIDSRCFFMAAAGVCNMPINDQAAFAAAIESTGFNPWVLPMNWNFHQRWQKTVFGPIRVWHDYADVPPGLAQWNENQGRGGAVNQCGSLE